MSLAQQLLPEYDQELAGVRKVLERVPEDRLAWRPHAKSMTLGGLATHVANLPSWVAFTLHRDELDIAPAGAEPLREKEETSRAELLAHFDRHAAEGRAALAAASDEAWAGPWSLLAGGRKVFTMPRGACIRTFVMNHLVHHRAQLGVYLRLLDVPVPGLYGPSADES
jgi:uncharacterized damage-inducible protein DinB